MIVVVIVEGPIGIEGRPSLVRRDDSIELPGNERISKRSIVRDDDDLPFGGEKISKRSLVNRQGRQTEEKVNRQDVEKEQMEVAANNIVFRPLFRSKENRLRLIRSVENDHKDVHHQIDVDEDMETAADIVFRPLFRKRFNKISKT